MANNRWHSVETHFQDGAGSVSLSRLTMKAVNTSFMAVCNLLPLRLPRIHEQQSLMLHWRSFSGLGRECGSVWFNHWGGQYINNRQRRTKVNILGLPVAYMNATINSESQNAEPEIWLNVSSHIWCNPWVDGYGSGFASLRGARSGFWTGRELKRPIFAVQTWTAGRLPGPVPNTDPSTCKRSSPSLSRNSCWRYQTDAYGSQRRQQKEFGRGEGGKFSDGRYLYWTGINNWVAECAAWKTTQRFKAAGADDMHIWTSSGSEGSGNV